MVQISRLRAQKVRDTSCRAEPPVTPSASGTNTLAWSSDHALQGAVLIQLGGVIGGLSLSYFLDRGMTRPSLISAWGITAIALLAFLITPSSLVSWGLLLLIVGAGVSGAQLSLNALSASYYPAQIKATGVGWVGVMGGAGSISGPLAGAWLIAQGLTPTHILALLTIPVLACGAGVLVMRKSWQAY